MAVDGNLLQGEVTENPAHDERDVEKLLVGFLRALLDESMPIGPDEGTPGANRSNGGVA